MNTKMTLNELKAKLDQFPDELGHFNVILVQRKGQGEVTGKANAVCPAIATYPKDGNINVEPLAPTRDYTDANAIVIASAY